VPGTQYETDVNLAKRQRLWLTSRSEPGGVLYDWVLGLVDLDGTERVLEVGCGNGPYLERVEGIGLDRSPGMLDVARARTGAPVVCGDAQAIPFADASFDVVLAPHMLYHVPDRAAAVRELRRVLRPGGTCIAVTNSDDHRHSLKQLVADAVGTGWAWGAPDGVFSLENGAAQLAIAFDHVETVPTSGTTFVTDADALADYVSSVADIYPEITPSVVEECRRRAQAAIDQHGAFEIEGRAGAFVCT